MRNPKPASKKERTARAPGSRAGTDTTAGAPAGIQIFVSYSHLDTQSMERLRTHLAALMRDGVTVWFDGDLHAGDELKPGIARALRASQVFVALLSPDYLASNYCWNIEYRRAMNRRSRGTMRVVAAVVRPCDWKSTRAANFKLLPRDGRPVTKWRSADEAFLDIAEGIRSVVKAVRQQAPPKPATARKVGGPAKPVPKPAAPKPSSNTKGKAAARSMPTPGAKARLRAR